MYKHQSPTRAGGAIRLAIFWSAEVLRAPPLIFLFLVFFLSFVAKEIPRCFEVFSAIFLSFSRALLGFRRGKKSLVFGVVFLGFYLNTKEGKTTARPKLSQLERVLRGVFLAT